MRLTISAQIAVIVLHNAYIIYCHIVFGVRRTMLGKVLSTLHLLKEGNLGQGGSRGLLCLITLTDG